MAKFLIIQTAFIGDVILATSLIEKLHQKYPNDQIDFLLRKGNESLLDKHPHIGQVYVWNKKENKYRNLVSIIKSIRKKRYDYVINLQRFASTGLITALSGAKCRIGFDKNPFSLFFTKKIAHLIGSAEHFLHETERNNRLIEALTDATPLPPRLYPGEEEYKSIAHYKTTTYICIAPTSVWYTKQFPATQWTVFIEGLPKELTIYLLGGENDFKSCEEIRKSGHSKVNNLAGKLSFLQTAALMKDAKMNYVNDSAPMHIASSMNAPVTAVYCSTVPHFGFGPLSEESHIVETKKRLNCRPCGLHGYKQCPEGHFKCAQSIDPNQLVHTLKLPQTDSNL